MTSKCNCWDCRRSRGQTPGFRERAVRDLPDGTIKRVGPLFQGGDPDKGIPPNADLTGEDRK